MKGLLLKIVVLMIGIFYLSTYFELQPQQTGGHI